MNRDHVDALRAAFREEAHDLLSELESGLLGLEERPGDAELVGRIFRALHTIKGSGGMAGFSEIADFSHEVESLFDLVRAGKLRVDDEVIDIGLSSKDVISALLDGKQPEAIRETVQQIVDRAKSLSQGKAGGAQHESHGGAVLTVPSEAESREPQRSAIYRIRFTPSLDLFAHGINPLLLLRDLATLGNCRVNARTSEIPGLEAMDPELCYLSWDIVLTSDRGLNAIKDVFIFLADSNDIRIDEITDAATIPLEPRHKRLGEILVERGDLTPQSLEAVLTEKKAIGQTLVGKGLVRDEDVASALAEQELVREAAERRQSEFSSRSIRVRSDKLDSLVDLVGELVTVQAGLAQVAAHLDDPELAAASEKVERLTADLRDTTMGMRMVPIGGSLERLNRLVRDLSRQLGKEAHLVTVGEETELDKTVIERLGDSLVHLVRNSLDHGIEEPAIRTTLGKPRAGKVHIEASQSGGYVYIKIADDGAGLDPDRILARAVDRGVVPTDAGLSEREILNLIFLPGFSTASTVTEISGRGVGMDVVKTTIESLRGEVFIESDRGKGTEVTLKIPLTLAIIEGLLVEVSGEHLVFPLSAVDECLEYSVKERAQEASIGAKRLVEVRGSLLPFISLRSLFSITTARPAIEQVIIGQVDDKRVGFLVDRVVGSHQTVIKNLGSLYRKIDGFSGATILGDGTMALILDLGRLVQRAESSERAEAMRQAKQPVSIAK